jgi:uncharacterized protein YijF (DUF1287 family)
MNENLGIYIDENWNLKPYQKGDETCTCSICNMESSFFRSFSIPKKDNKVDFSICDDCLVRVVILYNIEGVREGREDMKYNYAKERHYGWDFHEKHIKKHKKNT